MRNDLSYSLGMKGSRNLCNVELNCNNSDDLRSIFEPVVDQVIDLVRQQLNDANAEVGKDTINV